MDIQVAASLCVRRESKKKDRQEFSLVHILHTHNKNIFSMFIYVSAFDG